MKIEEIIIEEALKYLGDKEQTGNKFTDDTKLGKRLHEAGQKDGESWCSYFAESVWVDAYKIYGRADISKKLEKMFSANAVSTFENFYKSPLKTDNTPKVGSLVVFKNYKNGMPVRNGNWFTGHIAIVENVTLKGIYTIDGNSNSQGGREGIEVARIFRKVDFNAANGLRCIGFVHPLT
jgi:hypothetical protein